MARRKKEEQKGSNFMTTYADLITALFAFFVMMFAMSSTDTVKFFEFLESFNSSRPGGTESTNLGDYIQIATSGTQIPMGDEEQLVKGGDSSEKMDELYNALQEYIEENDLTDKINAIRNETNLEIIMVDDLIFATGEAKIKPDARKIIDGLGDFLAGMENSIIIEGHTDNRPINTAEFPSNWELSAYRAINIVHYLIDTFDIDPTRMTAIGQADTKPIVANDSEENMQRNRRVVIKINE